MPKSLSQKIVQEIQKKKIHPTAKWKFSLFNYLFWSASVLLVILGAVSSSIIIFALTELDWDLHPHLSDSLPKFILLVIPHLWIALLVTSILIGLLIFKKTQKGYRYHFLFVISAIVILSLVLGGIIYASGLNKKLEAIFFAHPFPRKELTIPQGKIWFRPEKGLLGGEITGFNQYSFNLVDLHDDDWEITYDGYTLIRGETLPRVGDRVKIIGEKTGPMNFHAREIRPWEKHDLPRPPRENHFPIPENHF